MSDNQKEPQYKLRWSEGLRDKVVESAKQHNRSINAEICTRLENSFKPETNLRETFEFEAMERIYKEQAKELKLLREMVEKLMEKPT